MRRCSRSASSGYLQVDGYSAYTKLAKASVGASDAVTLAGCWAHLRRRFYELHISSVSRLASQTVAKMAELWKVEDEIRGRDPAARMAARQDRSAAIVADLFGLWEKELSRISGKSKLGEAIRYATSRGGQRSSASSSTGGSKSTPTLSSALSGPKQ